MGRQKNQMIDLFDPVLPEDRLDPLYVSLLRSPVHDLARSDINAAFARMGDPNGQFAAYFQGAAFHARLFEIACFSYLEAAGFVADRTYDAPDFMVAKDGVEIAVEVVTANPPDSASRNIGGTLIEDLPLERMMEKVAREFPRRMNTALKKKVRRGYHQEAHVAGKAIVLMTQPAFEAGANFYIDESLAPCLFGDGDENAGFFSRDDARPISAIAYCNGFTVSKFWRLSSPDIFRTRVRAVRKGHCLVELSDNPCQPRRYGFEVGDPAAPQETWAEGVTLFLNPNADIPLVPAVLPASCTMAMTRGGSLMKCVSGFHPLTSVMLASPRK
ncbi:hypothetical protein SAMN02799626_01490 [Caulobacter sp. UNC279MFTsu5.1]|nr:hypothetical protein SAMN02799626_01490 [Caulobacter sp. UNC279MFTsu5.1]